jgi:hypothetical protein
VTRLEDALRALFASQVETPPTMDDAASMAIMRARAIRRSRTIGTCVAGVLVLVVVVGSTLSLRGWWLPDHDQQTSLAGPAGLDDSTPDASPSMTTLSANSSEPPSAAMDSTSGLFPAGSPGLDLRVGNTLWTRSGAKLWLSGVSGPLRVYRVPAGWVYGDTGQVRLLRPDGSSLRLATIDNATNSSPAGIDAGSAAGAMSEGEKKAAQLSAGAASAAKSGGGAAGADPWVLSADGTRLAFTTGTTLAVGTIGEGGLNVRQKTAVPSGTQPTAIADGSVVITDAANVLYDVWLTDRSYQQTWTKQVAHVYGAFGGGLSGLVWDPAGSGRPCVAMLKATTAGLRQSAVGGCKLGLASAAGAGVPSPDGRWVAEQTKDAVRLVDLAAAVKDSTTPVTCRVLSTVALTWASATTVVGADARGTVSCTVAGDQAVVRQSTGVSTGWQFVPSLGLATSDGQAPVASAAPSVSPR